MDDSIKKSLDEIINLISKDKSEGFKSVVKLSFYNGAYAVYKAYDKVGDCKEEKVAFEKIQNIEKQITDIGNELNEIFKTN